VRKGRSGNFRRVATEEGRKVQEKVRDYDPGRAVSEKEG